jgi:hypothetical protein
MQIMPHTGYPGHKPPFLQEIKFAYLPAFL